VLISGNADGTIIHWHATSGTLINGFEIGKQLNRMVEANNQVLCMDTNSDGTMFATGGKDFCV
jgi:WD40 repeat protein